MKIVKKSDPQYFFKNASHEKKNLSQTRSRAQHVSHLVYQMRPYCLNLIINAVIVRQFLEEID